MEGASLGSSYDCPADTTHPVSGIVRVAFSEVANGDIRAFSLSMNVGKLLRYPISHPVFQPLWLVGAGYSGIHVKQWAQGGPYGELPIMPPLGHSLPIFRAIGMCVESQRLGPRRNDSNTGLCLLFVFFVFFASSAVFSLIVKPSNHSYTPNIPISAAAKNRSSWTDRRLRIRSSLRPRVYTGRQSNWILPTNLLVNVLFDS